MLDSEDLLAELDYEVVSTEKLLNLVPADKLEWQPHPKAMTLGALALHVATISGGYSTFAATGSTDLDILVSHPQPKDKEEILSGFNKGVANARDIIKGSFGRWASEPWDLTKQAKTIFSIPRALMVRLLVFNHWYHHRGQLSTYLRTLGVKLPSVYGPSADEDPFA